MNGSQISPTWLAEKNKQVLDLIHADIRDGLYTPVPGAATQLESYQDLHDYVDANEYVIEVCGWDAYQEEYDAVAEAVDLYLNQQPIRLG